MSDEEEREERLKSLRTRVRDELVEGGVLEVDDEVELDFDVDEDATTLSDRIARRRRRMKRARAARRQQALIDVQDGGDPAVVRLPAALRNRSDEGWVMNLAVLLIIVGSVIGAASGALLISADPRDLVASSMFSRTDDAEVHGLILSELDSVNNTGGDAIEGVDIELIRISDDHSEGRTETNSEGRFTISGVSREVMLLTVRMDGYVTIERTLSPGEIPDLTLTLIEGEGVDSADLREPSNLASAVQLSTVLAVITLISAAIGIVGGLEARRGIRYRRTQWICGLGLFSRGGIFFGPLLILLGMALLMLTKNQFADQQ
ncbi:MAG: carboxypeptidase-like regulatory domain-containing protein [Candidatus Thalassarchaeaceae archaeon]|nr:carboxypeptidase-like regulatory domain-containing protein [Candidatus Thalassarchaeaceae archaeon]